MLRGLKSCSTIAALFLLFTFAHAVSAQNDSIARQEILKYVPTISGTFRAFYRYSTVCDQSRFEVANARLSAAGYVLPYLNYYIQADFDNLGKIKILDAYATVGVNDNLRLMMGQMRVPFSASATRSPADYYFADTELVQKLGNLRSVGVKAGFTVPNTAWYFEGGIFNAKDLSSHSEWTDALTYSIKTNWKLPFGLKPELCFMSRTPESRQDGIRFNQLDASCSWKYDRFFIEGEYIYRHYTGKAYSNAHAYDIFVDYAIPVRWRMASQLSFQARWDGISDTSNGLRDSDGRLITNIRAHRRLTVGVTASKKIGKLSSHFRLNFEQYFYSDTEFDASPSDNNQLVAGIMLHF